MTLGELKSMSVDELWCLREKVDAVLCSKISDEKAQLDRRLRQLRTVGVTRSHARRRYPPVLPKYRNPAQPSETWAGRGRQPRWLTAQLESGKKLDDFRIRLV
jgi:DNA-binding protein H-NS